MTNSSDDILLMQAVQRFQPEAERQLFGQVYKPLCLYAHKLTGNLPAAEDIVSEAFVKAFDRRSQFESSANFKAFLYIVVRNASISFTKTDTRQKKIVQDISLDQANEMGSMEPLVHNEILFAELVYAIHQEIENLPGKCRQVFKLSFFDSLSTEDIALRLAINPQTVRSHKARAIQMLKTRILSKRSVPPVYLLMLMLSFH
jgi:RNA polymerase sigma-70 factor (ECF subfamily)